MPFREGFSYRKFVSSAKLCIFDKSIVFCKLLMQSKNGSDPKINHWGTLCLMQSGYESMLLTDAYWNLFLKQLLFVVFHKHRNIKVLRLMSYGLLYQKLCKTLQKIDTQIKFLSRAARIFFCEADESMRCSMFASEAKLKLIIL